MFQEKDNFQQKPGKGCGCAIIILAIAMAFSLSAIVQLLQTIVEKW